MVENRVKWPNKVTIAYLIKNRYHGTLLIMLKNQFFMGCVKKCAPIPSTVRVKKELSISCASFFSLFFRVWHWRRDRLLLTLGKKRIIQHLWKSTSLVLLTQEMLREKEQNLISKKWDRMSLGMKNIKYFFFKFCSKNLRNSIKRIWSDFLESMCFIKE